MSGCGVFRIVSFSILALCSTTFALAPHTPAGAPPAYDYVPTEVLVKLTPLVSKTAARDAFAARHGLSNSRPVFQEAGRARSRQFGFDRVYKFSVDDGEEILGVLQRLRADPAVEYAEPNLIMTVQIAPDDPYYSSSGSWGQDYADMWGLHRIGLTEPNSGWNIERDEEGSIIVAVIDTGLDFTHPDGPAVWTNPSEIAGDEIDNDGNGFIDDVHGWDFVNGDNDPTDGHGHGTHCAGTIAGQTNNATGIAGISWGSRIMAVKGLSDGGSGSIDGLANALVYAADNGAHILSNSWGGVGYSETLEDAVNYAAAAGCLVVAAAGNSESDVDTFQFVPACFENAMAVAALGPDDVRAWFTNHGAAVAVSAPGVDVLSLRAAGTDMYGDGTRIVDEYYYRANGTSMACPHAASLAALVWAHNPVWDATQVRNQMVQTTDYIDPLNPGYEGRLGSGRINAWKALTVSPQPDLVKDRVDVVAPESVLPNGALDPGETVSLAITLRNRWLTAESVWGSLVSNDPYAIVHAGPIPMFFGDIPQGQSGKATGVDSLTVLPDAPYGHPLSVVLKVNTAGGYQFTIPLGLRVASPRLSIRTAYVIDPAGNDNGLLEPGETAQMQLTLANEEGSAQAGNVTVDLISLDPRLTVHQPTGRFGAIPPGNTRSNPGSRFVLEMAGDFPADGTATLRFDFSAAHGYSATREIEISPPGAKKTFWEEYIEYPMFFSLPALSAVTAPDGSVHTVYQDVRTTLESIRYAHWTGAYWIGPEPVGVHYDYSYAPLVRFGPSNVPHVTWMDVWQAPGWNPIPLAVYEFYYTTRDPEWLRQRAMADSWDVESLRGYSMDVDDRDQAHVAWLYMDWDTHPDTLYWYHRLCKDGVWQSRTEVFHTTDTGRNYGGFRLTAYRDGVVWLTWIRNPTYGPTREFWGSRWNGHSWTTPGVLLTMDVVGNINNYELVIDADERFHLLWNDTDLDKRMYRVSAPGAAGWSEPVPIADTGTRNSFNSLHLDADGLIHAAYGIDYEIRSRLLEEGVWSDEELLLSLDPVEQLYSLRLATDHRGHRHLIWNSLTDYRYARTKHAMVAAYRLRPLPLPPVQPSLLVR